MERLERLGGEHRMRPGLERMERLCERLGHPERRFEVVHVGGTNGKGSVCTKIARGLQLTGRRTGLTTSPHIYDVRERIQVDGVPIDDPESLLEQIFEHEEIGFSYFEALTALAFLHFAQAGVDIAVVEVGLGGSWDATNVVQPRLAVITSVDLDHTSLLGEDRETIAREKGGIIKPGVTLVLGPNATGLGLTAECCLVAPQGADYLEENRNIAEVALRELGVDREEALDAMPLCRFERRGELLLDVAHNPAGMRALLRALRHHYPDESYRFLVGFSRGKDVEGMLKELEGYPVHLVEVEHERVMRVDEIPFEGSIPSGPLPEVLDQLAGRGDLLVVCGSCFIHSSVGAPAFQR
jgi:dihydrofolate synthase / folylpolyglutamate synthase